MEFFNDDLLDEIKSLESKPEIIEDFLSDEEVQQLVDFEIKSKRFVERDDGTKTGLGVNGAPVKDINEWDPMIKEILVKKIEDEIGNFSINPTEFPPHYFSTKFPIKLHADTGHDPNAKIFKQILIPLKITPSSNPVYTIVFKRRWYGQATGFTSKKNLTKNLGNDYDILDSEGKFVPFNDIELFYNQIKNNLGQTIEKNGGVFIITQEFLLKIKTLLGQERYNLQSDKHILNEIPFDKEAYDKYLSHLDYDSLNSLEIDTIFKWKPGSAFIWDRNNLHTSSNYIKDNVQNKLGLAVFTIKQP